MRFPGHPKTLCALLLAYLFTAVDLPAQEIADQIFLNGKILTMDAEDRVVEALRTVTMHAASQSFDETIKGSLESGKLADFVVLDRDYIGCLVEDIRAIRPTMTVVGGKVVFRTAE